MTTTTTTSSVSSTSLGSLASPGVGSGLDVSGIVTKLMTVEGVPLTGMQTQATATQAKISAYGSVKSALAALQSALAPLKNPATFAATTATSADASVVAATAGTGATPGQYSLQVTQLAQAQKLVSGGFASANAVVGSGTLTFQFGTFAGGSFTTNPDAAAKTVTVAPGQNTLAGIRDAVNAASIGVTATIVNDGSAAGNRLVFTTANAGSANGLRITAADDDGTATDAAGLSQLAFDPAAAAGAGRNLTQQVPAQNALFTIDGIAISKPSNTVTDAIAGVTLNLNKENPGATTIVSVAANNGAATSAVQALVSAYNSAHSTLAGLTKYDATAKTASVLTGDSAVRSIQSQLRTILGGTVGGTGLSSLSQAGVTFQADGSLALDTARLNTALATGNGALAHLFTALAAPTDSLVNGTGVTSATQAGTYAVNVTRLATQGSLAGAGAAALTITAGSNDALAITVDGIASTVTLAPGSYASAAALAAEVQSKVNGTAAMVAAGTRVTASTAGGVLTLTSGSYGAVSAVTASGSAAATLFGAAPTAQSGVDVAGTINGVAATGVGQQLTGAAGDAAEGLRMVVAGGTTGARGSVAVSRGFADQLDRTLTSFLSTTGVIASRTDGANRSLTALGKREDAEQTRLNKVQAAYYKQYQALDAMMSSMTATSTYLTQQIAAMTKANS